MVLFMRVLYIAAVLVNLWLWPGFMAKNMYNSMSGDNEEKYLLELLLWYFITILLFCQLYLDYILSIYLFIFIPYLFYIFIYISLYFLYIAHCTVQFLTYIGFQDCIFPVYLEGWIWTSSVPSLMLGWWMERLITSDKTLRAARVRFINYLVWSYFV